MGVFLVGSNAACPVFLFGDDDDGPESETLLGAGYGVPLMWFFLFRPAHLHAYPTRTDWEGNLAVRIPATTGMDAAGTLLSRRTLVNSWFGQRGSLDRHIDVFADWLKALPLKYVTLDWWELCAEEGQQMANDLCAALQRIDAQDSSVVDLLASLSTTEPEHGFPYLEGGPNSFTQPQIHNFWMLLGDADGRTKISWP